MVVPALPLWVEGGERQAGLSLSCPSSPAGPSLGAVAKPFDLENMADTGTPAIWRVVGGVLSLSLHLMLW